MGSFEELVSARFGDGVNAFCWRRELEGDFEEIVDAIGEVGEICSMGPEYLEGLELSEAGRLARRRLIEDLELLRRAGLEPSLDCIPAYPRDAEGELVPTDVYDFHADSATTLADTYLCSYTVAASEGLRNEDVVRYVDVPEIRAELLRRFGGADGDGFLAFLRERFYDLHYRAREGAAPYSFGFGNLWRIATQCPGSPVRPCIHRAPTTRVGDPPRLLLIS
ncbi:hypothetical protein VDG1235_1099 [Verrucomicrobiia bacterium DG1235]|nr:hypothetical protein VDG1235_1099 [Verrucomicrobiae bacterium DG1235]